MEQPTWLWIASIPGCAVLTIITVNVIRLSFVYAAQWHTAGRGVRVAGAAWGRPE